jgi:excinuclease ABC subunit A
MKEMLDYYREQSEISSPGKYEYLYNSLPGPNIPPLMKIIQNILIHQYWIIKPTNYGVAIKDFQVTGRDLTDEVNLRSVESILERLLIIEEKKLEEKREPINRIIGNCRDYALLLTSMLRYYNIPARVRSGAALYFFLNKVQFEDHYVTEYWDGEKWCYADPQLDDVQTKILKIDFDTSNFSRDLFLNAGEVFKEFNKKEHPPEVFGIADWRGERFVRNKLIMDLASINKVEVLAWEGWGVCSKNKNKLTKADFELFKVLADLLEKEDIDSFKQCRKLFKNHPDLKRPTNYKPWKMQYPINKEK